MDSVAIVTGGSRGIGRATSLAAAKRGYKVVVGYASNKDAADEVVGKIEASNGKAIAVKCDVGNEADILDRSLRRPSAHRHVMGQVQPRPARRQSGQHRAPADAAAARPSANRRAA